MFKWFTAAGLLAAVLLVALGGCSAASSASSDTATVSGTLSGISVSFIGNPVITISKSGSAFPVEVIVVSGSSGVSGPYSIPNVPLGDYAIAITFNSPMYRFYATPNYSIDGGTPVSIGTGNPVGTPVDTYYAYDLAVPSISISKTATIDIYLGDNG